MPDALPAVFHCTAGKDRTGVLSAILLSLLGVDEPTVVADYALSGAAMTRLRAKIIVKYPDSRETIENISGVFSAEPAQMEALLDHLRATYGSIDAYVAGLGAGPDLVAGLRAALLEPAAGSGSGRLRLALGASAKRSRRPSRPLSPSRTSGRNRSMTSARARSRSVMPPESWVVRARRTLL